MPLLPHKADVRTGFAFIFSRISDIIGRKWASIIVNMTSFPVGGVGPWLIASTGCRDPYSKLASVWTIPEPDPIDLVSRFPRCGWRRSLCAAIHRVARDHASKQVRPLERSLRSDFHLFINSVSWFAFIANDGANGSDTEDRLLVAS